MKRKNKFIDNLSENQNSNKDIEKNDYSFQEKKKKNIINDLKQKGFNEIQIDDILETLIRNSISDRAPIIEDKNNLNIQETHTIDTDLPSNEKIGKNHKKNKKMEYINNNSKYKNSFIIKTENSETKKNNKKRYEYNCAKIYINVSTEKDREYYLDSSENIDDNNNKGKILNFKKYRHVPHITTHNNCSYTNTTNTFNSKKINTKFGNYINKFCSQYGNNSNRVEVNRKEILKKFENEINDNYKNQRNGLYNNYNFKMIFDSKKFKDKDNMENVGYVEIKNNSSRDLNNPMPKSRNINIEENKNNNSNSFSIKQKILSSINQVSFDLNEIKEEKENNENNKYKYNNEIKENYNNKEKEKDNGIKKSNENEKEEKNNKKRNKGKFNGMKKKEIKMNKGKKSKQDNLSIKFINAKKIFSYINNNGKNDIPTGKNKKNNIFMIRKQKTEEEEKLAKKNIAIVEIKQNDQKLSRNNNNILYEKNNKSKSLSKINNIENGKNNIKNCEMNDDFKRSQSNFNHTFVNINLCKDNVKNCSTFYKNRGFTIKENPNSKIRNHLHKEEIGNNLNMKAKSSFENINKISNDNEKDLLYNKITKAYTFTNTDNNNSDNNNIKKVNHILFTSYNLKGKKAYGEEEIKNKSNIDNKLNDNNIKNIDTKKFINIKIEDNLNIYLKKIKKYENGIYEGIMLNDKREIKGTMIYSNGAKYEGQWRNDKKNGKGIFTSSHYFNCKYKVGMKYEGEFKDDKFDGHGVTSYTNGDKFEGEWKNNKQYGKGVVSYFDGSKYDGEWKDGKFDGIGIFYLKNGEKFEGRFFDNKYNGYGKYYYNNGDYLEGIFKNDLPRGNCILHKSDGTTVNVQH